MKKRVRLESMWAIAGTRAEREFLYTGTWLTRRDAIREHCNGKGKPWNRCKADGDRAVKVGIMWKPR